MSEVEVVDHALEEEDALLLIGSPQEVNTLLGDAHGLLGHSGLTPGLASLLKLACDSCHVVSLKTCILN